MIYLIISTQVRAEGSNKKFRTIGEIRDEFHRLNMDMKTDLEILTGILKKLKNNKMNNEERVALLVDLEYYVHQVAASSFNH